jgi:hypothetical protein
MCAPPGQATVAREHQRPSLMQRSALTGITSSRDGSPSLCLAPEESLREVYTGVPCRPGGLAEIELRKRSQYLRSVPCFRWNPHHRFSSGVLCSGVRMGPVP